VGAPKGRKHLSPLRGSTNYYAIFSRGLRPWLSNAAPPGLEHACVQCHRRAFSPPLAPEPTPMSLPLVSHPTATDPVCGMQLDPPTAPAHTSYRGTEYYFCCPHCLQNFQADPEKYLAAPGSAPHAAPHAAPPETAPTGPGVEYVCPMHPEVR